MPTDPKTDPKTVAAEFGTGDDLTTFLTGLFQNLPASIDRAARQAALDAAAKALPAAPAPGSVAAIVESLRPGRPPAPAAGGLVRGMPTFKDEWDH